MVTTGTAGSITTSSAALSGGSVNAESGSVTSIQFCYSTTSLTNCTGGTVSTVAGSNPTATGSGNTAETATLSSLSPGTTYYVNLEGISGGVTYYGTPTSFTTAAVPTVTNGSAGSITASGATLSGGSVNANNDPNTHAIAYCYSTTSLTNCTGGTVTTVAGSNPTASGSSATAESATLSGLAPNTKYYFNLEATNSAGTVTFGTVANFTTLNAPVVTSGTAGSITTSSAALSGGSVNAESGSVTSIQFCYSTTSLTNCTGGTVSTVAGSNPTATGSGNTAETATLSSLSPGTTYYVNLEGISGGVTYYGTPTSFTTTSAASAITIGSPTTFASNASTDTTGSFTAPANTLVVIVVTIGDNATQTCPAVTATNSSLTSITSVANEVNFASTGGNHDGECLYSAKGGGTSGTVSATWSNGPRSAAIQMIDIPDASATVAGDNGTNANNGNSPQSPTVTLATGVTAGDYEVYVGDATINASTLPTWSTSAPSGFARISTQSESDSTDGLYWNSAMYYGPAATTVTGSVTDSTNPIYWGVVGIEIHP